MTLCLLPNIKGFKRLGEPKAGVQYEPSDLLRFIEKKLHPAQHHDGTSRNERDRHLPPHPGNFPLLQPSIRRFAAARFTTKLNGGSVRQLVDGCFFFAFMGIGALIVLYGDERRVAIDRHFV